MASYTCTHTYTFTIYIYVYNIHIRVQYTYTCTYTYTFISACNVAQHAVSQRCSDAQCTTREDIASYHR